MEEVSFGYKTAWLAVRTDVPNRVVHALGLQHTTTTPAARGVQAAYDWDPASDDRRVFVTPPIHGWVLCVGQALFGFADSHDPEFADLVARLSRELRCDVQFFCTHRIVEAHGWARAVGGQLLRAYLYVGESGETVVNTGEPTADELHLGFAVFASPGEHTANGAQASYPTEEDVIRLAGRWSVNPTNLPAMSDGLLGDLPWRARESRSAAGKRAAGAKKPWWKFW